jgi:hypothetical protein
MQIALLQNPEHLSSCESEALRGNMSKAAMTFCGDNQQLRRSHHTVSLKCLANVKQWGPNERRLKALKLTRVHPLSLKARCFGDAAIDLPAVLGRLAWEA